MCDSRPYNGKSPPPGIRAMQASGDGFWEVDLSDGSAWFSDWFSQRLGWVESGRRATFSDLRPSVSPQTWDALLGAMRAHLEGRAPFDLQFQVQLGDGQIALWHFRGMAQRSERRHPTYFDGIARDVTLAHTGGMDPSGG